jgi:hypothetical protein
MSEMYIKGQWKGIKTSPSTSEEPVIGMIYQGVKTRARIGSGMIITGLLMQVFPQQGDAILRDKENFPHCVDYKSLKIVVSTE